MRTLNLIHTLPLPTNPTKYQRTEVERVTGEWEFIVTIKKNLVIGFSQSPYETLVTMALYWWVILTLYYPDLYNRCMYGPPSIRTHPWDFLRNVLLSYRNLMLLKVLKSKVNLTSVSDYWFDSREGLVTSDQDPRRPTGRNVSRLHETKGCKRV